MWHVYTGFLNLAKGIHIISHIALERSMLHWLNSKHICKKILSQKWRMWSGQKKNTQINLIQSLFKTCGYSNLHIQLHISKGFPINFFLLEAILHIHPHRQHQAILIMKTKRKPNLAGVSKCHLSIHEALDKSQLSTSKVVNLAM